MADNLTTLRPAPTAQQIAAALALLAEAGYPEPKPKTDERRFFMRVWIVREHEVREALKQRTTRAAQWLDCLRLICAELPGDSQRVPLSQAAMSAEWNMDKADVSRCIADLRAVGALLLPQAAGKSSRTFEVDASYASRMDDTRREAAMKRQALELQAERAAEARKAAAKGVRLREVPFHPAVPLAALPPGRIDDARQEPLLP